MKNSGKILIFVCVIAWIFIIIIILSCFSNNLPSISLPKDAQHNTFGELPIVEVMDDGNFYEVDGQENWSYYDSCVAALNSQCGDNDDCKKDVIKACRRKNGIPKCDVLTKIGDLYFPNTGLFFTCDIDFNAVMPDKGSQYNP